MTVTRSARLPLLDPADRAVVVDLETTGFNNRNPRLCDIGAVEVVGGRIARRFQRYVNPGVRLNPAAVGIHGLTEAFLADHPRFLEVASVFLDFIGDAWIVFHNAGSDVKTLNHDLRLIGLPPLDWDHVACTQKLVRALFPGAAKSGLDAMCDLLEVDRSSRASGHGALVDAELTAECLIAMSRLERYALLPHARPSLPKSEKAKATIVCSLDEAAGQARFTLPDGRVLVENVPDFPAETHVALPRKHQLIITRKGENIPDNPSGIAILSCKGEDVLHFRFENGRSIRVEPSSLVMAPTPL